MIKNLVFSPKITIDAYKNLILDGQWKRSLCSFSDKVMEDYIFLNGDFYLMDKQAEVKDLLKKISNITDVSLFSISMEVLTILQDYFGLTDEDINKGEFTGELFKVISGAIDAYFKAKDQLFGYDIAFFNEETSSVSFSSSEPRRFDVEHLNELLEDYAFGFEFNGVKKENGFRGVLRKMSIAANIVTLEYGF